MNLRLLEEVENMPPLKRNQSVKGLNICVTGKVVGYTRRELHAAIMKLGGFTQDNVTKRTNVLVSGTTGTTKWNKATDYGIEIMNAREFVNKYIR